MIYACDLHLHSRYASGVSKHMTLETLARQARRKGIDILGTGDCLQPEWLRELESKLEPAEPGWFAPAPRVDQAALHGLPALLHGPLRFVLSTEISCTPPGTSKYGGLHHLVYFPSFDSARAFQKKMEPYGSLAEGRPSLALTSRQLLESVLGHDARCHLAPAHVLNPYFSSLGSQENHATLEDVFGELTPRLLAVETGLTSTPPMCRRIASLDSHALFSNSDAHSPGNIGRECTLLEIQPGYDALFAALGGPVRSGIIGTLKFPIERTRFYLNRCGICEASFEGRKCPQCGRPLAIGSRDRLEAIATRASPLFPSPPPPFRMLLPLRLLLAEILRAGKESRSVGDLVERLLSRVGHERFILAEAGEKDLADASTPGIARRILGLRNGEGLSAAPAAASLQAEAQMPLL
jgi:DNA helicase-2/ATP-dependent DNA helicase PcrA